MYNDGVKILYFNTNGTKGGTESLKHFLKYLEESKEANITDEATKEVSEYVRNIKNNAEIGGKYMTFGDYIDNIVAEAVSDAVAEKDETISKKDETISKKDQIIAQKDAEIEYLRSQLNLQK